MRRKACLFVVLAICLGLGGCGYELEKCEISETRYEVSSRIEVVFTGNKDDWDLALVYFTGREKDSEKPVREIRLTFFKNDLEEAQLTPDEKPFILVTRKKKIYVSKPPPGKSASPEEPSRITTAEIVAQIHTRKENVEYLDLRGTRSR